jgi:two-component system sensor histidine kinase UhpB
VDAPAALVNELGDLEASALELADDLRQLSHDLHPAILEHAGLAAALRAHCSEVARVAGLSVAVTVDGIRSVELDAALCLCLYRVAQEALRNVVKHAGAGRVEVSVVATGGAAALVVSDDGRGFEPAHAPRSGLGLVSMAERVRLIRGTLAIESAPGRGTQVRARVPIAPVG